MSRQNRNAKKSLLPASPPDHASWAPADHCCVVCTRSAAFGVFEDGRNSAASWYCRDHIPRDRFTQMDQTFISMFEEAFFEAGGSRPQKSTPS